MWLLSIFVHILLPTVAVAFLDIFKEKEKPIDYIAVMKEYDGNVDLNHLNLAVLAENRTWLPNRDTTYARLFYHVYKQDDVPQPPHDRDVYLKVMRTLRQMVPFLREVELDGTDLYDVTGMDEREVVEQIRLNYTNTLQELHTLVYAFQSTGYIVHKAHGAFFFRTNDCTPANRTRLCRDHVGILRQALAGLNATVNQAGATIHQQVSEVPFEYETSHIYNLP